MTLRKYLRYLCSVLVVAAAARPLTAQATISPDASSVQPTVSIVALGHTQSIVLHWNLVSSIFGTVGGPIPYTVTSTSGRFIFSPGTTGGFVNPLALSIVLGTVNTMVSGSGVNTGTPSTVRVTESLTVPAAVVLKAHQLGATRIKFERQFDDGSGPLSLDATLVIGGSSMSQFAVTREALSFDDESAVRVVQTGDELSASARINFIGSGSMRAVWEIAGPSSTPGKPQFRQLAAVTRGLIGHGPEVFKSPALPTATPGYYVVRLRITDPLPGFDTPQLSYYVGDKHSARAGYTPMVVTGPDDGAIFSGDTRFSWRPVSGAKAYKVELFASPGTDPFHLPDVDATGSGDNPALARKALSSPPAAGMIVAASQTEIVLSSITRARLRPRSTYFWRVQAIGADGAVIGAAQARQLRVP